MKRKRFNKKFILVVVLLLISIGYAILSSHLSINGNSILARSTWDVHFENVVPKEGRVSIGEGDSEATINPNDNTEVNYSVTLSKPGDFYEFNVDIANGGSIDAQVEKINSTIKIDEDEPFVISSYNSFYFPSYLGYSITYVDGSKIKPNHILKAGDEETIKVRLEFLKDIDEDDLPEDDVDIDLTIKPDFIQKNELGYDKDNFYTPFIYETDLESIQNARIQFESINYDNYEECVTYFENAGYFPNDFDLVSYCRGEDVEYEGDTYDFLSDVEWANDNDLAGLSDAGVINVSYAGIEYDIDEEKCNEVIDWLSDEDLELYCSGRETSDDWSIAKDVQEGYSVEMIDLGIIKNVVYSDIKPDIIITGYKEQVPTNLVIPSVIAGQKVVGIADYSFDNKGITSVSIPETVEYVGESAFNNNNLSNVNLKGETAEIGNCAFGKKENILHHNIPDSYECATPRSCFSYGYKMEIEDMYTLDDTYIVDYDESCGSEVIIPYGMTRIGAGAFSNKGITSVVIPNTVNEIYDDAFNGNNLSKVELKGQVQMMDKCVFGDISNIAEHNIPNDYYCEIANGENAVDYLTGMVGNDYLVVDDYDDIRYDSEYYHYYKWYYKEELDDFSLRYSYLKNFVKFNNELWRIIGIFDVAKTAGGPTEKRIKLTRDRSIGTYSWNVSENASQNNAPITDWSTSVLMRELNTDYLDTTLESNPLWYNGNNVCEAEFDRTKALNSTAQGLIDDAAWTLSDNSVWVGKVGLPYRTDLDRLSGRRWLNNSWTLNTYSNTYSNEVFYISYWNQAVLSRQEAYKTWAVTPTVYLKSNVKISGEGTYDYPYEFSLN